jgi:hypothetical protein
MSKRTVIAVVAAVAAFGAVSASAAGLGGLTGTNLGADAAVVASCDTDGVGVDYVTAYTPTGYAVNSVSLTGLAPACMGQNVKITLADTAGASIATAAALIPLTPVVTSQSFTLSAPVSAKSVANVSVVISG